VNRLSTNMSPPSIQAKDATIGYLAITGGSSAIAAAGVNSIE